MRVLLQRVTEGSVSVDNATIGRVDAGLLLLVGFGQDDTAETLVPMARKIVNLRVFEDEQGRFNHSLLDTGGGILAVPQFTLYGRTAKGRRPDFTGALSPEPASALFDAFVETLAAEGAPRVETGEFGAHMRVGLVNDGPVTLMLELP